MALETPTCQGDTVQEWFRNSTRCKGLLVQFWKLFLRPDGSPDCEKLPRGSLVEIDSHGRHHVHDCACPPSCVRAVIGIGCDGRNLKVQEGTICSGPGLKIRPAGGFRVLCCPPVAEPQV